MQRRLIRRTAFGPRLNGFNVPTGFDPGILYRPRPFATRRIEGGYLTKRVSDVSKGQMVEGGIYDGDGRLVTSDDFTEHYDLVPDALSSGRRAKATVIERRCVYLGNLYAHFGHFLVETLARAWAATEPDPEATFLFRYPGPVTGQGFFDFTAAEERLPSFVKTAFELLGLRPQQVIFTHQDIRVRELIVPSLQFRISSNGSPGMCRAYDKIADAANASGPRLPRLPRKVYFTRRYLESAASFRKTIVNENEIEDLFVSKGFTAVAPERISFREQILLASRAEVIAGTTGSALHMSLFNSSRSSKLIAIDWRNSRTQYILDLARDIDAAHVYCFSGRAEDQRPRADAPLADAIVTALLRDGNSQSYGGIRFLDGDRLAAEHEALDAAAAGEAFVGFFADNLKVDWHGHPILIACLLVLGIKLLSAGNASLEYDELIGILPPLLLGFRDPDGNSEPIATARLREDLFLLDLCDPRVSAGGMNDVLADADEDCIVIVRGFFDTDWPRATETVLAFLAAHGNWAPLLIEGKWLVLVASAFHSDMIEGIRLHASEFLKSFGVFTLRSDGELAGRPILSLRGGASKMMKSVSDARASRAASTVLQGA